MHAQGRVRYISSILHHLAFPELWKPSLPTVKYDHGSVKHPAICALKYYLKSHGLSNDTCLLQHIMETHIKRVSVSEEFEAIHPNTLFRLPYKDYQATPLCSALIMRDSEMTGQLLADPETDVNLAGYYPHHKYHIYTPLDILIDIIIRSYRHRYSFRFVRKWIPKLIARGAIMSIDPDLRYLGVHEENILLNFIEICAEHEPLRHGLLKHDPIEYDDFSPLQSSDEETD